MVWRFKHARTLRDSVKIFSVLGQVKVSRVIGRIFVFLL